MSKEQYIEFPKEYTRRELNARYREIPLKDTTSRLLRKYFNAMANLYGIITLHKAKEILFSLSPKLVTEDEFLAFAEIARHECEGYYILGGDELYTDVKHTNPLDREIIDVILPLDIAVHHEDGGGVVVHLPHNAGHGGKARQLAAVPAPLSGDDLVI